MFAWLPVSRCACYKVPAASLLHLTRVCLSAYPSHIPGREFHGMWFSLVKLTYHKTIITAECKNVRTPQIRQEIAQDKELPNEWSLKQMNVKCVCMCAFVSWFPLVLKGTGVLLVWLRWRMEMSPWRPLSEGKGCSLNSSSIIWDLCLWVADGCHFVQQ